MTFWTCESIKAASGGTWAARPREGSSPMGASIDTRTLSAGQLFFALKGERVDGHAYLDTAAERGAALAVVDTPSACGDPARFHERMGVLVVPDAAAALLRLGAAARGALGTTRVVSIGGSNGKTTTTRLVQGVLSAGLRGTASPKSFNNALGVPLTLLNAVPGDAFVVAEVGTNAPGEIATLAQVVRPDVAVITSIGREHLEGLGSLEGVAREEAAILTDLAPGGVAILNADAPHLLDLARTILATRKDAAVLTFGTGDAADLRITSVQLTTDGLTITINGRETYRAPLIGRHNAGNIAAAAAVGKRFGLDAATINAGLATARPPEHRLQRHEVGGMVVVDDAYNANPESMRAAIETFAEIAAGAARRVVVLGDMLELGPESASLHHEIGSHVVAQRAADVALLVGPLSAETARAIGTPTGTARIAVRHFADNSPATIDAIARTLRPGDAVLLKGSRRMALERVVAAIKTLHMPPTPPTVVTPVPSPRTPA
jgi:UDP-N-acetylmuramoyl-tripeptide--D-alanyl-D-alanine ligase